MNSTPSSPTDAVFDNQAYIGAEPDVAAQLRKRVPSGCRVTRAARDGAVLADVPHQLMRAPTDATHLVISAGGNDALRAETVLDEPVRSVGEALLRLSTARERFAASYEATLAAVRARGLPVALCTIYDPRIPDPTRRRIGIAGLALFNDVIARAAFANAVPLLDLRLVCDTDADFANSIESSAQGCARIAGALAALLAAHNPDHPRTQVFTGA